MSENENKIFNADIVENKDCFQAITWTHLFNCLKAFESGEYMASAIFAAVFTESLLKDILDAIPFPTKSSELGSLSDAVTAALKSCPRDKDVIKLTQDDKDALDNILRRVNVIRETRNWLVHDTRAEVNAISNDARNMHDQVIQIIDFYVRTSVAQKIREDSVKAREDTRKSSAVPEPTFPVFLSTITPHTFEQEVFIGQFRELLRSIGINPVQCKYKKNDRKDPMGRTRDVIAECNAVIVLGLERSHAYLYCDREGSKDMKESTHRHYSSSWLQLEAGMAIGMKKELFVVCQPNLYREGIFDEDWNTYTPYEIEVPLNINSDTVKELLEDLKQFMKESEPRNTF